MELDLISSKLNLKYYRGLQYFLNKNGIDINDWLMEQITEEQINNIIVDIITEINRL